MLELKNITKSYNGFRAVNDLSLKVPAGVVYGLLGPNGAGKTTTIRMIMNIIVPDCGEVLFDGHIWDESMKNRIGYLPEERGLYQRMKVNDVLVYLAALKGVAPGVAQPRVDSWLSRVGLSDWKNRKINELSKGMQQKIQFISTIIHNPALLILDEPFSGLDPINTTLLKDILLELKGSGTTIILSTHLMEQAEKLCDYICLINKSQKVLDGGLAQIKSRFGKNSVIMAFKGTSQFLKEIPEIHKVDDYGQYVEIQLKDGANPQHILRRALDHTEVWRFELAEPSLNDIFIRMVTGNA